MQMVQQQAFSIPDPNTDSNPRWRTGKRVFRLTSSSTDSEDKTNVQLQQRQITLLEVYKKQLEML